jgi:hypothetical protein
MIDLKFSKEPKGAKAKAETRKTSCGKVKAKM